MFFAYRHIEKRLGLLLILLMIMACTARAQDPNANPNWDWRAGDDPSYPYPGSVFTIYYGSPVVTTNIKSPWSQFNAPDVLDDNRKEDGWVLVCRDFGTSTRAVATSGTPGVAYFALYNKPRALLRIFLLVKAEANFSTGSIIAQFISSTTTATLDHFSSRAYATDKTEAKDNKHSSALTNTVADGNWVWGDYPMAFDPTIVSTTNVDCARIFFQVIGTSETSIHLNGTATGVSGSYKNVRDFLSGGSNGLGVVAASEAMPTTVGTSMDFNTFKSKVFGTSNDWNSWKTTLDDMYKNLGVHTGSDFLSTVSNHLALAIGDLKQNWIVQNLPVVGAAVGLVDFLTGGGNTTNVAKTSPTYYAFNLSLEGSAVTQYKLGAGATIPIPAVKSNPSVPCLGSSVPLLYNDPVGLFILTKTPILRYRSYTQWYNDGSNQGREYWDFQVKEGLQYQLNSYSGLLLDSIRAWIVMDPSDNVILSDPTHDHDLLWLSRQILRHDDTNAPPMELESTINGKYVFRSVPVDGTAFMYQTIVGPVGNYSPDMTIKIKAVFHRADDPTSIPIVAIYTYEPDFEDAGTGRFPAPPYPVVAHAANKWNMVSVPNQSYDYVNEISNFGKTFVYPTSTSSAFAYGNSGYYAADPLINGLGYWLKFSGNQKVTYLGPSLARQEISVPQRSDGWSMIGAISTPLDICKVQTTGVSVTSHYFGYASGYYDVSTASSPNNQLQPGQGYWVKVSGAGKLTLDVTASCSPVNPPSSGPPPACAPDALPSVPVLYFPTNGTTNQSTSPTFSWNQSGVACALSYRIQVSLSSNFSSAVFDQSGITSTLQTVSGLSNRTLYYWRVNATNNNGTSAWSGTWSFTTGSGGGGCTSCCATSASSLDQFTITDAQGNHQQLFAVNGGRGLDLGFTDFEMPPEPLPGAFNVRFHSNRFVETIPPGQGVVNIPIRTRDVAFPVTISWKFLKENNTAYTLVVPGGERTNLPFSGTKAMGNPGNGMILLQAQSSQPCPPAQTMIQGHVEESLPKPAGYALRQNLPNPFNPSTWINYELPEDSYVRLKVYNLLGQEVATLVDEMQDAGYKTAKFDASNLPSGMYVYRLNTDKFSEVKKMMLIK